MSATCSPGWMARHTSTALRAPASSSVAPGPNIDPPITAILRSDFRLPTYDEGGHLSAAGGHVGEPGGTQAGEESSQASTKNVRREIYQHVARRDAARGGIVAHRKQLTPYGDALLRHPAAVALRDGACDCRVPFRLARFPSKRDACAPVLVVGLDHELIAACAQEREQIHGGAATRNQSILDERRPRDMPANDLALVGREEPGMTLIGEHREEGLLVRDL